MFPTVSQLDSFTDVFGEADEVLNENFSQPLSLPTTCDSPPESITNEIDTNVVKTNRPAKHAGQYGEFRCVEEIDPKYRCLFTYPYFNLVQSRIIEDALYSDKSLVVCAPTGSGKTVVFELAILQLLMQMEDGGSTGDFKIIYMAPVKAVCNERLTEWYPKLTKLGLLCIEVTGDTEVDFSQLGPYRVIITTPEKWDMLTRRWRDHRGLVEMIKLFLIDEVHILNDETRGPVLEAVVSRMKTVESAAQSAHRIEQLQLQYQGAEPTSNTPPRIRFIAVSATVSNPEDVADWLGTNDRPAVFHKFGDECRPVKLQRIVEGYSCAEGTNAFKFDLILNYKLWPIIQKYYNGKPTLIFCNTRKSVTLTAEALSREVTVGFSPEQKAKLTALASTLKNKKLQMLAKSGVGCHHAGLLYEERVNIERAFRNRDLPILVTTTTLAMGVNLPAHLVIVKNTQQYLNGAYQEYSISTVLQMVGRAGRPQFDTEATAVIMTRLQDKPRYQALVGGSEPLQSYLHKRLAENLNSEAALGTVTDVAQCVEWLRSTFLYVRAAKDPRRYLGLPPAAPQQLILKKIEELCVKAMNSLASSGLISMDEASCIESTEAGRLMSLFYMDVETMKNIMKIEGSESLERLLWLVCESHELSDMHLRVDERRCLNLLNRNNKAATIRFPMKGKISTRQMKLNCIIQAVLGCLQIPEPALNQEALKVMRTASRVCKCLVKYVTRQELPPQPKNFSAVLNSIILSKCIEAHLWENSAYVSKQLKGIGTTFSTLLASAGITSFMLLEESHPRDLERIMNKGPPAGNIIRKQVSLLPKYQLNVTPIDARSVSIQLILLNHAHLSENMDQLTAGHGHKSYLVVGDSENHLLLLTQFTDKDFMSVYDGTMQYEVRRKLSSQHKILIHCVSSVIVGIDVQAEYLFLDLQPQVSHENYHDDLNISRQNFATKQTVITDIYKERKRKNDNDITQCKEKKKRENTLTQKLKALKESFSKTSKSLKSDVDKSVEMSNKVIHDLLERRNRPRFQDNTEETNKVADDLPTVDPTGEVKNHRNKIPDYAEQRKIIAKKADECPIVDLTKNAIKDTFEGITMNDDYEDDDYIDDLQIDSILSKIECEIIGNEPVSNNMLENNEPKTSIPTMSGAHFYERPVAEFKKVELKSRNNATYTQHLVEKPSRCVKDSNKRKNLKSNYSFMDTIEKKANTSDDCTEKAIEKSVDSGFSDAIKTQINKFLKRAQNTTIDTMPVIDKLLDHSKDEELPPVSIKKDLPFKINTDVAGYRQNNNNSSTSDYIRLQCDDMKSPITLKDAVKLTQNLNDHIDDFDENHDLPEVNIKNMPTIESKYNANQEHTLDKHLNNTNKEFVEYEKLDLYDNSRGNNNTQNNDLLKSFPNEHKNTNLTCNRIADCKDMPENFAPIPQNERENSIPMNTLEPVHMTAPIKVSPGENHDAFLLNAKLAHNSVTHDGPVKFVSNHSYFTENKNISAQVLHTTTNQDAEKSDLAKLCEKIVANFESDQNKHKQMLFNNMCRNKSEHIIMKSNQMDMNKRQLGINNLECIIDCGQTAQLNAISTCDTFPHSQTLRSIAHNSSTTAWGKKIPDKPIETLPIKSDFHNALITYNNGEQPKKLDSYIPKFDCQNIFSQQNNDKIADEMSSWYQNKHCIGPSNFNENNSILVPTKQIKASPTTTILNTARYNENLMKKIRQPNQSAPSIVNINTYRSDTENLERQDTQENVDNRNETYFKRFSYSATKVDVCTKKFAPDHELRITRKLKVDVDVTEIVKQDKANKTNGDTNKEDDHKRTKQNIITTQLREEATQKNDYFRQGNTHKPIEECNKENDDMILKQKNGFTNQCEIISTNNTVDADIVAINKPALCGNIVAKKQKNMEDKLKIPATTNSIGNILQKYSKILTKPETFTPIINKINKKIDTTTASVKTVDHSSMKTRKPFKITEINAIDVKLPISVNLTNSNTVTYSQIEPTKAKRIKTEAKENVEICEPKNIGCNPKTGNLDMIETEDINVTPEGNYDQYFESPVSNHSLQLDSTGVLKDENVLNTKDIKDENMFNPKLLLQYFTEDNDVNDVDIIAPPADFSDNAPVYSPVASQETKEFYNHGDFKSVEEKFDNLRADSLQYFPNEIETWCLSKDDEAAYDSPVQSSPWVVSQRAHSNLGPQRGKLCQFKFVRKKQFRP